jgi:galactokinase
MFDEPLSLAPGDRSESTQTWTDYPVGVLRKLQELGINPPPFSLNLRSDLANTSLEQLEACCTLIPHKSFLRCRHIISEDFRVLEARKAMFAGDPT